jgi:hypothetical protein
MTGGLKDRLLVPGRLFRDLDGSLVHLVSVEHDLCSWVPISAAETNQQVTHRDNFRRRFRSFDTPDFETKATA